MLLMTALPRDPSYSPLSQEQSPCRAAAGQLLRLRGLRPRHRDKAIPDKASHLPPRPAPPAPPASARRSRSATAVRTSSRNREDPLHASTELFPEAAESPALSSDESRCTGSLRASLRIFKATHNQPYTDCDKNERPHELQDMLRQKAHLVQQQEQSKSDQDQCPNRLLAPPEDRWHGRNGGDARIHESRCGRRWILRLVLRVRNLLITARGCARIGRSRNCSAGSGRNRTVGHPRPMLRSAQVQPVADFVQAQRIRQRLPVANRLRRVKSLERLIQDPRWNKQAE